MGCQLGENCSYRGGISMVSFVKGLSPHRFYGMICYYYFWELRDVCSYMLETEGSIPLHVAAGLAL